MKRVMILFFIVNILSFSVIKGNTDNKDMVKSIQMKEEIELLKNQIIELNNQVTISNNKIDSLKGKLEEIKKKNEGDLGLTYNIDQIYKSSLIYYKQALLDIKWIIGIIGALFIAAIGVFKWDNNKKLKEERTEIEKIREEIKNDNKVMENEIKNDNKDLKNKIEEKTLKVSNDFTEKIRKYEKQVKERIEDETKKLENKLSDIIKDHEKEIKEIKKEINKDTIAAKFNNDYATAISKKTPQESLAEFKKIEKYAEELSDYDKHHLYFKIAYFLLGLGNLQTSLTFYNKAIALDIKDPTSYNNRGEIYLILEHFDLALLDLTKCLEFGSPEFMVDISQTTYDKFKQYLESLENKNDLEQNVYIKLIAKDGFTIIEK